MQPVLQKLIQEASAVVLDKTAEIKLAVTCLLAGGHLLIEDVPGVGKTTLVQTLAKLSGLNTHRIQFTVDLLPAGGGALSDGTSFGRKSWSSQRTRVGPYITSRDCGPDLVI